MKESCNRPVTCRGYCENHYEVERRNGRIENLAPVSGYCRFENCDRLANGRDQLCGRDRERERKGIYTEDQLTKRPGGAPAQRDEFGRKQCNTCNLWLPESEYYAHPHACDGLRYCCKSCFKEIHKRDPDKDRLRNYGLTAEDVAEILRQLDGKCPICNIDISDRFVVDHDNKCCPREAGRDTCGKCVRGLICGRCNSGLGMFLDNPQAIRNAADYLEATMLTMKIEGE